VKTKSSLPALDTLAARGKGLGLYFWAKSVKDSYLDMNLERAF
jgi:hypothetical protein